MNSLLFKAGIVLPLFLISCDRNKEEEEIDYDHMVHQGVDREWTSAPDLDHGLIAGDLYPEPQEVMIQESADSPSKLDGLTIR